MWTFYKICQDCTISLKMTILRRKKIDRESPYIWTFYMIHAHCFLLNTNALTLPTLNNKKKSSSPFSTFWKMASKRCFFTDVFALTLPTLLIIWKTSPSPLLVLQKNTQVLRVILACCFVGAGAAQRSSGSESSQTLWTGLGGLP